MWYNELERVGVAGSDLTRFLAHAKINAGEDHCFLIRLDNIQNNKHKEKDALIKLYENGEVVEGDFLPPAAPAAPSCSKSLFNGLQITAVPNKASNSHISHIKVGTLIKLP